MAPMTARDLNRATLARQGLLEPIRARSVAAAIERIGSLQAQHPEWPPVALAARAVDARGANLLGALERRSVVRSSLMRITIHVVSAADLWPMFAICQPLRLSQWRLLARADPIDSKLGRRMIAAHQTVLAALNDSPRSSTELDRLMAAEVGPVESPVPRIYWRHLAALIPMVHIPHAGEGYGRSKYAVAADWLGVEPPDVDLAEARVHAARRYLGAFGPASVDDLVAYVGRGRGGVGAWREAIAALGDEVITLPADGGQTLFDLDDAPRPTADTPASPRLLARWDSILLSHAPSARGRIIADEHRPAVFSKNADVRPTFLIDGMVAGTWDFARASGDVMIEIRPFERIERARKAGLESEAQRMLGLLEPGSTSRRVRFAPH